MSPRVEPSTPVPGPDDPSVLFVNIGWGERYDGTEHIVGNHEHLTHSGDDCSEQEAFLPARDGRVSCWVGRGSVDVRSLDLVLVARKPGENGHRIVGIYFDVDLEPWGDDWTDAIRAATPDYHLIPVTERPRVDWPGRMSMRRWAHRPAGAGTHHPALYVAYRKLLAELGRVPGQGRRPRGELPSRTLSVSERIAIVTGAEDVVPRTLVDRSNETCAEHRHSHFCALDPVAADLVGFEPGQSYVEAVRTLLRRSDLVSLALTSYCANIGFFEESGLAAIIMQNRPGLALRLMFAPPDGLDHDLAVWLHQQVEARRIDVREFPGLGGRSMHAKVVLGQTRDGRRVALLGSANATTAAIRSNEEFSCAFSPSAALGPSDPFHWFDEAWEQGVRFDPVHFITQEITLRRRSLFAFQIDAQHALQQHLAPLLRRAARAGDDGEPGGHGGGLLVLPTGAGKTLTAMRWIFEHVVADTARHGRVLWLSHRTELLEQAHDAALHERHFLGGREIGIKRAEDRGDPFESSDVVFVSAQRAHAALCRMGRRKRPEFGLIVVDEAHRASTSTVQYGELLAELPHKVRLGLTATPYRGMESDLRNFARVFTCSEHRGKHHPTAVFSRSVEQLEREPLPGGAKLFATEKRLVVPTGFRHRLAIDNETGLRQHLHEFDTQSRNRKIVDTYFESCALAGPAIVFCLSVEHANKLASAINRREGLAQAFHEGAVPKSAQAFALRGATMSTYERAQILRAFAEGRIRVLCCMQLLTEGFDLPGIASVLLARPTMSTLLLTQMIGRGLRGPAVGGSHECLVVDFSDQLEIHRKRDATARLRVARPTDAERYRRGQSSERDSLSADTE